MECNRFAENLNNSTPETVRAFCGQHCASYLVDLVQRLITDCDLSPDTVSFSIEW